MRLSIVVPALDEAGRIVATLAALAPLRSAGHEVIVVDGGSRDGTAELAQPGADAVLHAPRGRATQMNVGAAFASGDALLFLHADTLLPRDAPRSIARALADGYLWGRFDVTIEGRARILPLVARLMNARSRLTGIATGDQAIFVERALFAQVGGFPPQPLMEDVALSVALKRAGGRPACIREPVVTSGRRWDARGPLATIAEMGAFRLAYWCGVNPRVLARRYHGDGAPSSPVPSLLIFAKEPRPGHVKTRLAAAIGEREAAAVHRELVEQTLQTARRAREAGIVGRVELWCTPRSDHPEFAAWRDRYRIELRDQVGGDLGERMRHALVLSLARGVPALLIGSDCPLLDPPYLGRAAAALADHDAVFGPAEDGGYVLVGLARDVDPFAGIVWGTAGVMVATRARLASQRATWQELPVRWDVDTAADLARWRSGASPPVTAAA